MERYKQVCRQISEQINPSDEFIQDLKMNLNKRVSEERMKRKAYFSKVAMIFCTLTFVSTGVFASNIGDWFANLFSNVDETMQIAIENGCVQNVEMDYVEHAGIGIKVNSLIIDDNKMNIVFEVQGEIDGELVINEIYLWSEEDKNISENLNVLHSLYNRTFKSISKDSHILIIRMLNLEQSFNSHQKLNITLKGIQLLEKNNNTIDISDVWNYNVLLEEDNFKNTETVALKYVMKENKYIDNYEINVMNTGTNIKMDFTSNFDKHDLSNKENIYIELENGEKYLCREISRINEDMIELNIPITVYDNIDKFDIVLNLENEKIRFNVEKENS